MTEPSSACPASSKPAWKLAAPLQGFEIPIETGLPTSAWTASIRSTSEASPVEGTRRSARLESSRWSNRDPGSRGPERLLDRLVGRRDLDDDVRAVEVAAEPRGTPFDGAEDVAAGELLEEVLDQVLLRQPLDQLDLLDRHRGLVRGRAREIDLGRPFGADQPEELVVCDDRDGDAGGAAAPRQLGPELGEAGSSRAPPRRREPRLSAGAPPSRRRAGTRGRSGCGAAGVFARRPPAGLRRAAVPARASRPAPSGARARPPAGASPRTGARSRSRPRRARRSR